MKKPTYIYTKQGVTARPVVLVNGTPVLTIEEQEMELRTKRGPIVEFSLQETDIVDLLGLPEPADFENSLNLLGN